MNARILAILTLLLAATSQADPVIVWERREALPSDNQWVNASVRCGGNCEAGGFYLHVGRIGQSSPDRADTWLWKQNLDGSMIWNYNTGDFDDEAHDVHLLSDQSFVVCGKLRSDGGNNKGLMYHRLADGTNNYWSRLYTGRGGATKLFDVEPTSDGGYIASGITYDNAMGWDLFLLNTNSSGDSMWGRFFGSADTEKDGYFVAQLADGGYAIGGTKSPGSHGGSDMYLVRTNSLGDTMWTRQYGTSANDELLDGKVTQDGGFVLAGLSAVSGAGEHYLVRLDSAGDVLWSNTYGTAAQEETHAVAETAEGQFAFAGGIVQAGQWNGAVGQVSADGTLEWLTSYGGSGFDIFNSVIVDTPYLVFAGNSNSGSSTLDAWSVKVAPNEVTPSNVWTIGNSPYYIYSDVLIPAGDSLVIEAGVQVIFRRNAAVLVEGTLLCEGTYEDSVRFFFEREFPSDPDSGWGGLRFSNAVNCSLAFTDIAFAISASGNGAGVHCLASSPIFHRCKIRGNRSWHLNGKGGGAYLNNSSPQFLDCAIVDNYCLMGTGGGVSCENNSSPYFYRTDIARNYARSGGGLHLNGSSAELDSTHFGENRAVSPDPIGGRFGGAIFAESASHLTMQHCVAAANIVSPLEQFGFAAREGCLLAISGATSTAELVRCTFLDNANDNISSVAVDGATVLANSSIFYSFLPTNLRVYNEPGLLNLSHSDIFNATFVAFAGGDILPTDIGSTLFHNSLGDFCDSQYNITEDPELWREHQSDDRLRNCSACIDAGDSSLAPDLDGTTSDIGSSFYGHTSEFSFEPAEACSATTIVYFPFCYRGGSTAGRVNDFSFCARNTAPDLIFTYTPVATHYALLDLCTADYDALLEVRTGGECPGDVAVACNDDHPACGLGARLSLEFLEGQQYWIIIDGSGSNSGAFDFTMSDRQVCELGAFSGDYENEPCPFTIDTTNGGCFSPVFRTMDMSENLHGTSFSSGAFFDTDWYRFLVDGAAGDTSRVLLTAEATFPGVMSVVTNVFCPIFTILETVPIDTCDTTYIDLLLPAGEYFFVISSSVLNSFPCSEYQAQKTIIRGGTLTPCPVEPEPGEVEESVNPEPYPPGDNYAVNDPNGGCIDDSIRASELVLGADTAYITGHTFTYFDSASNTIVSDKDFWHLQALDTTDIIWSVFGGQIGSLLGAVLSDPCEPEEIIAEGSFVCTDQFGTLSDIRSRVPAGDFYLRLEHRIEAEPETLTSYSSRLVFQPYVETQCPHDFSVDLASPHYTSDTTTCGATDKSSLRPGRDHVYRLINPIRRQYAFSLCNSVPAWSTYLFLTSDCGSDTIAWNDNACFGLSEIPCVTLEIGSYYLTLEPGVQQKCNPYELVITACSEGEPCYPVQVNDLTISAIAGEPDGAMNDIALRWSSPTWFTGSYTVWGSDADNPNFSDDGVILAFSLAAEPGVMQFTDSNAVDAVTRIKHYVVTSNCP